MKPTQKPAQALACVAAATLLALGCSGDSTGTPDPATSLSFIAHPTSAAGGAAFETQPRVELRNAAGERVGDADAVVAIALGANAAGGTLSGTLSVAAVDGVATFEGLSVDRAGTGYTLVATAAGLAQATSPAFEVAGGGGSRLAFTTQPPDAVGGEPFTAQPVVAVQDAGGNPVGGEWQIELTLDGGTTDARLTGTTVAIAEDGVATFDSLVIDRAGTGYRLVATAEGLAPGTSNAFAVAAGPVSLAATTVSLTPVSVTVGESGVGRVQLRDAGGNPVAVAGRAVTLRHTQPPGGTAVVTVGATTDNGDGTYDVVFTGATAGETTALVPVVDDMSSHYPVQVDVEAFTEVSAGWRHTCALTESGRLRCWGDDTYGQLGSAADGFVAPAAGQNGWTAVSAGYVHTCALAPSRALYCWGNNDYGQLGTGATSSPTPARVSGALSFASVSTSLGTGAPLSLSDYGYATCALTTGGAAYCWGDGRQGQLGTGSDAERGTPTPVSAGGALFGSIGAGAWHSCAVTTTGNMACWGNRSGLGGGVTAHTCEMLYPCALAPVAIAANSGYDAGSLTAGLYHSCALRGTTAYCWDVATAAAVAGSFTKLAAGRDFTCGIGGTGEASCWGTGTSGQLGNGGSASSATPVTVSGGNLFTRLDAGSAHACGIADSGGIYCWGSNSHGQLTGEGTDSPTPRAATFGA